MASIERTAYPRFRRFMSARELHVFYTPAAEEIAWARENAGSGEHLLGLLVQLKTFSRLGYFPALDKVPAEIAEHIRRDLRLPEAARAVYASTRTAERHRNLIRARSEVIYDPPAARKVAAEAIKEAAYRKNDPADLINIALERLVEGSYELPAFRTLNDMATTIRARVNEEILWPISPAEERDSAPGEEDLLALAGSGDLRDQARNLAMATPAAELRDAFQVAAGLSGWADGTCAAVERELAAGQPGDAVREWITSAFGPVTRLLMAMALRDQGASPASTAVTAVGLIFVRNMIRAVRQLVPAGSFDVMSNPLAAPSFLTDFLGR